MIFVDIIILIFHLQASVPFLRGSAPEHPALEWLSRLVWPRLFRVVHQDLHYLSCGASISQRQRKNDPQSNDQPCPPKSCMISQSSKDEYINRKTAWAFESLEFPCKSWSVVQDWEESCRFWGKQTIHQINISTAAPHESLKPKKKVSFPTLSFVVSSWPL